MEPNSTIMRKNESIQDMNRIAVGVTFTQIISNKDINRHSKREIA